jgi:hypothetical protein
MKDLFAMMKIGLDLKLERVMSVQHKTCCVPRLPLNPPTPEICP